MMRAPLQRIRHLAAELSKTVDAVEPVLLRILNSGEKILFHLFLFFAALWAVYAILMQHFGH
jgi:hypothetical protein